MRLRPGARQPRARFDPRVARVGAHARFAKVPRELLFPVRPRFHRRPGTYRAVLRRSFGAGRDRDRRGAALGRAGEVVALPGFLARRLYHAARTGGRRRRPLTSRRAQAAGCGWRRERAGPRLSSRAPARSFVCPAARLPCPADMKPEAYRRNLAARAFDVARYLLFWGIPTNVGQVTSIRTLEKQIRRLKAAEYQELRDVGDEIAQACAAEPDCVWDANAAHEALAPALARHAEADEHAARAQQDLRRWADQNLPRSAAGDPARVDLIRPADTAADIVATLLYPVTDRPFRELYEMARGWSAAQRAEVLDVALESRTRRDDLLAGFHGGLYAYDFAIDIGAYRDLHRHRRCHKFRQSYSGRLGFATPALVEEAGATAVYREAMDAALSSLQALPAPGAHYLLPFGARGRFLFKMDFAEAEYISRVRSGVKGHFSYRQVAWEMKLKMEQLEPELGRLMQATPPWVEDMLKR